MSEPEDIPQYWRDLANRYRQHVEKHPNCFDRAERLSRIEMYERYASEEQAKSGDQHAKSSVLMSLKGDQ